MPCRAQLAMHHSYHVLPSARCTSCLLLVSPKLRPQQLCDGLAAARMYWERLVYGHSGCCVCTTSGLPLQGLQGFQGDTRGNV